MENTKRVAKCPKCGEELELIRVATVNSMLDEDLREKILDQTLFKAKCEHCGAKLTMTYDFMYHGVEDKLFLVNCEYGTGEEIIEKLVKTQDMKGLAEAGYRFRKVYGIKEMAEKILIFERGMDDKIVETVKIGMVEMLDTNYSLQVLQMYLYEDKERGLCFQWKLKDKRNMGTDFQENSYDLYKEHYKKCFEEDPREEYLWVNARFALDRIIDC